MSLNLAQGLLLLALLFSTKKMYVSNSGVSGKGGLYFSDFIGFNSICLRVTETHMSVKAVCGQRSVS